MQADNWRYRWGKQFRSFLKQSGKSIFEFKICKKGNNITMQSVILWDFGYKKSTQKFFALCCFWLIWYHDRCSAYSENTFFYHKMEALIFFTCSRQQNLTNCGQLITELWGSHTVQSWNNDCDDMYIMYLHQITFVFILKIKVHASLEKAT